jgi:hypothetical protein
MKRLFLAASLFAAFIGAASAFDFGMDLQDLGAWYSQGGSHILDKFRAELWFTMPFGPSFDLAISGWYDFSWLQPPSGAAEVEPYAFDVGKFVLNYYGPVEQGGKSWFKASAGRFAWSDSTGYVINSRIDGLTVDFQVGNAIISGLVGYTGLFPVDSMPIFISADDTAASEDEATYFSSPRLVAYVRTRFVELFLRQDMLVDVGAQFDLHASPVDPIHSQYLSLAVSGALATGLYHDTFVSIGLVESSAGLSLTLLASGELSYHVPSAMGLYANLGILYASSGRGVLSSFRPIVQSHLGFAFDCYLGNNLLGYLSLNVRPFEWLKVGIKGMTYFRSSDVEINDAEFVDASTEIYLGTEAQAYLSFLISSDFALELQGGVFFPYAGGTFESTAQPRMIAACFATLSL